MGGGRQAPAPAPLQQGNNSDLLMMQMQMQQDQAEIGRRQAEAAQQAALLDAQKQQNATMAREGMQKAQQSLSGINAVKSAEEAASKQRNLTAQQNAGASVIGSAYDVNAARQGAMSNLGAASGVLPSASGNITSPAMVNPALTTAGATNQGVGGTNQRVNQFATPSVSGLTFGGA